ncbi:hypothetical protein [Aeoliella mucimassa]|uniref:Uncharacterized protein n=1 Tax=Aeoliella mucimassa TaxID=2527972 RepID=A0A518AI84_9BACT|nr:hypothetical protein [Aeoliella mucimassa]QDU54437.1 hypothetical protein Pan181_06180 [Aeoliella mucimassa]
MTDNRFMLCSMALMLLIAAQGCQSETATDKKLSTEEMQQLFASDFTRAFEENDPEAMQKLFYFEGTPKELQAILVRASLGKTFLKDFSGKHTVESTDFKDYDATLVPGTLDFDGKSYVVNLTPTWLFSAKTTGHAGFENSPSTFEHLGATTIHNGRIVFCGAKPATP